MDPIAQINVKNFLLPVVGIYFAGCFIAIRATFACYMGIDLGLPLWLIPLFLICFSTILLFENQRAVAK